LELVDMEWGQDEDRDDDDDYGDDGERTAINDHNRVSNNGDGKLSDTDIRKILKRRQFDMVVHFSTIRHIEFNHQCLKELSVISMSIDEQFIESLAALLVNENSTLEKLDLSDSRIMHGGPEVLGRSLRSNRSLLWLSLSECNLQDGDLNSVVRGLQSHSSIAHLDVSFNKYGPESVAVPQLAQLIIDSPTLITLNVGFCAFGSGRQVDLRPIFNRLCENPTSITTLQIGGNNLRDDSMADIVAMLAHNEKLEQLDLSHNRFSNDAIETLARNLGRMGSLRVLHLDENDIDKDGVQHLVDYIPSNQGVHAIGIDEKFAATQAGRHLALHLDLNWGGQRILVEESSIPSSLWPQILARANNWDEDTSSFEREPSAADIIVHFLRKGPLLLHVCTPPASNN
ncbi:MAG: hypothetical protein SGILL_007965, partial [Bacillariaceae sp.]